MEKALLIVDYSYDFVADDGKLTCGRPGQSIDRAIADKFNDYVAAARPVFIMMDLHHDNDPYHPETKLFPPHNIAGTPGRELYGRVKEVYDANKDNPLVIWIDKTRYSAFAGTNLHQLLAERCIQSIEITGVCTDICVFHTAVDGYNLGYDMTVDAAAVQSFNEEGHRYALSHFRNTLGMTVHSES
ncbi:cysteine hydrolase [Macrococcus equipercicus]|uniref:Cysteine hydrolase n=1 Tax=Macrococcus equipercicus TaxID=69967 RepID=A0ABQ6R784_9STAP|nr:isochorismatase family cysteine hydrolase [Macrococcus equipercicus]KAA1037720.1 cysteine hydrolase [Macrococcus equipercicus]